MTQSEKTELKKALIGQQQHVLADVNRHSKKTGSGVIADVPPKGSVLGYPATESREMLKQWVALKRLAKQ